MSISSSEIMFWGRALHKYVNMHVYICEMLFSKTQSTNLALTFETHFFSVFWKRALHLEASTVIGSI